jgi:peptidoglycan/LPS O-acetylase OafA/YrhL
MQRHKYQTLDMMRGVAAVAVAGRHLGIELHGSYLAVDIFFMLSGFVLASAYERRLNEGIGVVAFVALRLIRLYPLYLLGLFIGIGVYRSEVFASGTSSIVLFGCAIALRLLFLPAMVQGDSSLFPFDAPSWSLFFELVANALHARLAKFLTEKVLLFFIVISFFVLAALASRAGSLDVGWVNRPFNFLAGFPRVTFGYFGGVLLYRVSSAGLWRFRCHPIFILSLMLLCFSIPLQAGYLRIVLDLALAATVFPVLVYAAANTEMSARYAWPFVALGSASYAIYVLHLPLAGLMLGASYSTSGAVAFLLCLIGVSWLLDRFYDQPIRSALTRLCLPGAREPKAV